MNDNIQQPPVILPSPQGYPPQAYPNGIYPLAAVYPPLPQGHVYVQGEGYYPPQGYPHPMGMRYPPQGYPPHSYHPPQYDAPPYGHGQGYPPQKQKQNQATTSIMGGCCAEIQIGIALWESCRFCCQIADYDPYYES